MIHYKYTKNLLPALLLLCLATVAGAQTLVTAPMTGTPHAGEYYSNTQITVIPNFHFTGTPGHALHLYIAPGVNCVPLAASLSANQNYVSTITLRSAGFTSDSLLNGIGTCQAMQSVTYIDGLGRNIQSVQLKGNADATKDLIQVTGYDVFGREYAKYLPYAGGTGNGAYQTNAFVDQNTFYNVNPAGITHIPSPFATTVFDNSPLNRPVRQGAPGDPWQPYTATDHTVKMEYPLNNNIDTLTDFNNSRKVVYYTAGINSDQSRILTRSGYYPDTMLTVTVVKDENWTSGKDHTTEEYKDREGHVVLKRAFNGPHALSTYYIYDDKDNLAFVLPPGVWPDNTGFTITQTLLDNLCYQYQYDERERQTAKKIPGKGWEYAVYNVIDQLVATQDARQQARGEWIITKYDGQGRPVITGIWNSSQTPAALTGNVAAQTQQWEVKDNTQTYGYTLTNTYPGSLDTVLTVNYYDDYDITGLPYDHHTEYSQMTTGLPTATQVNILGTTDMLWAVSYYDDKGRATHVYKQHYLGGTINAANYDHITNTYDFTGQLVATNRLHYTATTGLTVTITNGYAFDQAGRKVQATEQINGSTAVILNNITYNDAGQVINKKLHSTNGGTSYLQSIDYTYNERSWLKTSSSPLFAMQLNYSDGTIPQYNGNIANQLWGTPGNLTKNYVYSYDALNRLNSGVSNEGYTENGIMYDDEGNIEALTRQGTAHTYSYNYNKLSAVSGITTGNYNYDVNGNMTIDARNSGLSVSYNQLNLPSAVGPALSYVYDATGQKLRKISGANNVDYIGGIQYTNGGIDLIQTEEGRAIPNAGSFNYEYNLSDHLGNTRLSFDTHTGSASTTQQDDYLPFGEEINRSLVSPKNEYLYNKKELQEETGQYDYGARFYDPVIGRWLVPDPLTDLSQNTSPYIFCINDPILITDKLGLDTGNVHTLSQVNIVAAKIGRTYENYLQWINPITREKMMIGAALDYLNIQSNSSNMAKLLINSQLHRGKTNIKGNLLDKIKKDPAMAKFKADLLKRLKANPQLRKLHFSEVETFGGEKENIGMNVAGNVLTWAIRHAQVNADVVIKTDETIVISYSITDKLDLTPQEHRNFDYNVLSFITGVVYHGIDGGSMDMLTQSNWSETIQPTKK